tara:strand:- start:203 stop:1000 length:798 start_codon:yes stop_codon:yes gene_type:complete
MINDAPIGIFDSGLGGLTVLKQIQHCLPFEDYIYFGDTAHLPYGSKSNDCIIDYSYNIANFLISKNVKAIIIACNSASSVAKEYLQQQFDIPIFEVITPSVEHAVNVTNNKRIGIIGTETTIKSKIYSQKISNLDQSIYVEEIACPLFVPIIEEGLENNNITTDIAKLYLDSMIESNIDTLILGCTHYPIIKDQLSSLLPKQIKFITSGRPTGIALEKYLFANNQLNNNDKGKTCFYVSDAALKFKHLGSKFLNNDINNIKLVQL